MAIIKQLLLLAVLTASAGNTYAQQAFVRRHMNFDADWKFSLGNAANPARDFNYGTENIFSKSGDAAATPANLNYNDAGWQTVQLPHDWVADLPFQYVKNEDVDAHGYKPVGGLFPENSIGWYRKTFTVNHTDSGDRYVLQFDGIYRDSKVWLNGYYIGRHFSGYNVMSFDITDFIRFDKKM